MLSRIALLTTSLTLLSACGPHIQAEPSRNEQTQGGSTSSPQELLAKSYTDLEALTADKSCDTSEQCQVMPVGHRACGGPSGFVIYSTKTSEQNKILLLGQEITRLEKQINLEEGRLSTCQQLPQPGSQCINHRCEETSGSGVYAQ